MKNIASIALSVLIAAGSSAAAFAQGPDQPLKHPQQQQQQPQHQQQKSQPQQQQERGQSARNDTPQHNARQTGHGEAQRGQQPDFRKGHALPGQYRGAGYQVNDWKKRGLKAPPSGHRWQNVNGNYVLIAVATGVIASVIAHQ